MRKPRIPVVCKLGSFEDPCLAYRNGNRKRHPKIMGGGHGPETRAQRYYCKKHRHSFSLPPKSLLPKIHYEAEVVNQCMELKILRIRPREPLASLPHRRTISRWAKGVSTSIDTVRKKTDRVLGKAVGWALEVLRHTPFNKLQRIWQHLWLLANLSGEDRSPYFYVVARSP